MFGWNTIMFDYMFYKYNNVMFNKYNKYFAPGVSFTRSATNTYLNCKANLEYYCTMRTSLESMYFLAHGALPVDLYLPIVHFQPMSVYVNVFLMHLTHLHIPVDGVLRLINTICNVSNRS